MPHAKQLEARRKELLARCDEQRKTMSVHNHELAASASRVDRALAFVGRIKEHPGVIVALVAGLGGLIAIRPRRLAPLVSSGLMALKAMRVATAFAPLLQGLRARSAH